jgi:tRNA(Ile)-lysidine synthase
MIKVLGRLPEKCIIAFSGGVDSVAAADFFLRGRRSVELAYFHHGTDASEKGEEFSRQFARQRNVHLHVGRIEGVRPPRKSQEEFWRDERYKFLSKFDHPVVTAHHLDDAVETWIFTSLHGAPRLIPPTRGNVIRPFLLTPKSELRDWCTRRGLEWSEDASNGDVRYMRNLIRHKIVPEALVVNPGLRSLIRRKYMVDTSSRSPSEDSL